MKKEFIILIIIVLLILGIIIFLLTRKHPIIKEKKKVEVPIRLTAGIPYRWEYEIEDETIVKFDRYYTVKDENTGGISGGHVYMSYVFEGIKPGKTIIHFRYISIDDRKDIYEEKTVIINVDNDLKTSIVNE